MIPDKMSRFRRRSTFTTDCYGQSSGTVPVTPDGSFAVKLPANRLFLVQVAGCRCLSLFPPSFGCLAGFARFRRPPRGARSSQSRRSRPSAPGPIQARRIQGGSASTCPRPKVRQDWRGAWGSAKRMWSCLSPSRASVWHEIGGRRPGRGGARETMSKRARTALLSNARR